jgi:hypothetical protein
MGASEALQLLGLLFGALVFGAAVGGLSFYLTVRC